MSVRATLWLSRPFDGSSGEISGFSPENHLPDRETPFPVDHPFVPAIYRSPDSKAALPVAFGVYRPDRTLPAVGSIDLTAHEIQRYCS
jgi:hypothetical protein